MGEQATDAQARMYSQSAHAYDELVRAEDADGNLLPALSAAAPIDGALVADVGAGTGRIAALLARAAHVHLVDRAPAMLAIARARLERERRAGTFSIHEADARALPLADGSVDVAIAGWVFGHFRHWMPEGWRAEVAQALREMERVARRGGAIVVVETLGTGHEAPRSHPALDEYFAWLEAEHGFGRTWIRTDYAFASASEAARVLGAFFGPELAERVRVGGSARVPECTAIFSRRRG